jgi:hypothetical protein
MEGETSLALTLTLVPLPTPSFLSFDQFRVNLNPNDDTASTISIIDCFQNLILRLSDTNQFYHVIWLKPNK